MNEPLPFCRVGVIGLARTGWAVVETLAQTGASLFVSEGRTLSPEERARLAAHGVEWEDGRHSDRALEAELLVPSPGVPPHAPILTRARQKKIPVWSEIELAFRLGRPAALIAITGTNGKTTTTELVGTLLREAGHDPVVAGNIGRPAIASAAETEGRPWVLEVSSYQLEWTDSFRPEVAVWLNFAPDHLDHHRTLGAYFAAKSRILAHQGPADTAVLSSELAFQVSPRARVIDYSRIDLPHGWGTDLPPHLRADLQAAWAASVSAYPGIRRTPPPYATVSAALRQPHRMEVVGEIRGIPFVNDSKGTNAHATLAALSAVGGPVVLILGGRHKGGGYERLVPVLQAQARRVVLIGESQGYFADLLARGGIAYDLSPDPGETLRLAYRAARPGDTVLLSPACASFDQFSDYAHRGNSFRSAFFSLKSP